MSQSYFYIRVSSEKNIHRIITYEDKLILVRLKIDNTITYQNGCAFCSKLDFFADIVMKIDFTIFFFCFELLFLTRLYYKIMYDYLQI